MMRRLCYLLTRLSLLPAWGWNRLWEAAWKGAMLHCGHGVRLSPMSSDIKGLHNLSIGDGTSVGRGATFFCTRAPLTIGRKVIFGPHPTIITGDHRTDIVGRYIIDVGDADKLPCHDAPVVVGDDVWIGANVTILKGVTIGRGSVVAAGAVVKSSCPPYSVIAGVPARVVGERFDTETARRHEALLNGARL